MAAAANQPRVLERQLCAMFLVCGIPDIENEHGNKPTELFLQSCGFGHPDDLITLTEKQVSDMVRAHNAVPGQEYRVGIVHQSKLQALVWWAKDRNRRGQEVDHTAWNRAQMNRALANVNIEAADSKDTKLDSPGKVETGNKWPTWDIKWENYLASIKGATGVPLDYVVRRDLADGEEPADNTHDQLKYETVQFGEAWNRDNMTVYKELKACCLEGEAWTWIKSFDARKDGKAATSSLREHYEGAGEVQKRNAWALSLLEDAHYTSEQSYSFEKFSTKLQECFSTLNDNGEYFSDQQMVRMMLDKINVPNNMLMGAAKMFCSSHHGRDFSAAVAYLSGQISTTIFPGVQAGRRKKRTIQQVDRSPPGGGRGRGRGRYGGRGHDRGGRNGGRGWTRDPQVPYTQYNGIDIADPTREFSREDWDALGYEGRGYVARLRRGGGGGRGRGRGRGRNGGRGVQEVGVGGRNGGAEQQSTPPANEGQGGRGGGRGAHTGVRFGGGAYN